jgi:hypothetical protein
MQPDPVKNNHHPVIEVVRESLDYDHPIVDDLNKRALLGKERYGVFLQPFNGRDALTDLYEEALDAVMYSAQLAIEKKISRSSDFVESEDLYEIAVRFAEAVKKHMNGRDSTHGENR